MQSEVRAWELSGPQMDNAVMYENEQLRKRIEVFEKVVEAAKHIVENTYMISTLDLSMLKAALEELDR